MNAGDDSTEAELLYTELLMRRILYLLAFFLALPLSAGVSYKFEVKSGGLQNSTMSGRIEGDGPHMRMDIDHGDPMLFKDKSIVISNDSGKSMTVLDPAAKTYYVLDMADFLAGSMKSLKEMGADVSFTNTKADVHDGGAGPVIEGYPTRKISIDASYDIVIDMMGKKVTAHTTTHSEVWRTDKLPAIITPFQMKGLRSGIEGLDKIIDLADKTGSGFPLRQETVINTTQGSNKTSFTQTMTVSDVKVHDVPAADFVLPAGYTKTENPIEKMLGAIKK